MKKTLLLGTLALIAGCAGTIEEQNDVTQADLQATEVMPAMPCSYPCMQPVGCMRAAEPVVLKPRVVETSLLPG